MGLRLRRSLDSSWIIGPLFSAYIVFGLVHVICGNNADHLPPLFILGMLLSLAHCYLPRIPKKPNDKDHRAGQDQPEQSTTGDVAGSGASPCWADSDKGGKP